MTNVFDFKDYKDFLSKLVTERKERGETKVELAIAMNCQAAYLSQVLGGKAHLTEDQGVKLCLHLEMDDLETEYFLVLLRIGRASTDTLIRYLEEKKIKLNAMRSELDHRIGSKKENQNDKLLMYYCSSWMPSVIHAATSCPQYQTVAALAQKLKLEKSVVEKHLKDLEAFRLVKFEKGKWVFQGSSIHFPKNSPLDLAFQMNRRLFSMNSLATRTSEDFHYSVVFAATPQTAKKIKELFLKSVDKLHKEVEPSPSEEIYSVCLDFFKI